MTDADKWFLLVQLKRAGRTDVTAFDDGEIAATAYSEAERRYESQIDGNTGDVSVLLVGASSLDVVKAHYPSFFLNLKSRAEVIKRLRAYLNSACG